jgi:hypothetical protein
MNPLSSPFRRPALAPLLVAVLAGCATLGQSGGSTPPASAAAPAQSAASAPVLAVAPVASAAPVSPVAPPRAANTAGPSASGVAPGTPQPATPPPGSPQAFAAVIKDAKKIDGLFTLYQKDEKVWFELKPEDFDKPFFLSPKIATGIGEAMVFGGLMDQAQVIEFRRIHNQVQMLARNTDFTARAGTPEGRAVAAAFSPSLLASTPVASQPNPTTKAVLVEANALFVNDMLGIGMRLQRAYRQGYGFDGRNSAITTLRGKPDLVALQVLAHFATGSISMPQPGTPPGAPVPTVPSTVPDARSLFVTLHYSISPLPQEPMRPRASDARIGHFTTSLWDFSDDLARSPVVRHVDRWRLEKQDPAAELSEPVKPLVYWLDRTIPLKYRDAITAGILEWNKAFERIGFKDAIQVKVQPEDADFDTLDGGASVRWMTNASAAFGAIGPRHVDPRSGEILSANIGIESLSSRGIRALRSGVLNGSAMHFATLMQNGAATGDAPFDPRVCLNADQAAEQLSYAIDVLSARGEIDPNGPEAQQFVLDYLKDATMHEVGHTLGLRHNFRASTVRSAEQLADPTFTRDHSLTGSVMEYAPVNLAGPGAARVSPFQATLGPYDYWAIEYAYKPIAAETESAALERIAARSAEPELAFATDEDNYLGIDPGALQFDLGNDALAFARKRLAIARDLFKRQETRPLPPDQNYAVLRRSLSFAINDAARSAGVLARQIGGVRTLRDFPGSGRDPLQPVPASLQRDALDQLSRSLLTADSFAVSPALQRRLAPDFQERAESLDRGMGTASTDYSLPQQLLGVQRALLNQLLSDAVASRIIDSQGKTDKRSEAFQLSELYARLDRDIWSELSAGIDITAPRRELQREHLNRIAALLLRPGSTGRADSRSLVRAESQALLIRVNAASLRPSLGADTRAHLQDCAATLSQAVSAQVLRAGV